MQMRRLITIVESAMEFDPSPTLEQFLWAEIRNEEHGGDLTTLGSALDSLHQMPEDVVADMSKGEASAEGLAMELKALIARFGADFEVEDHLD